VSEKRNDEAIRLLTRIAVAVEMLVGVRTSGAGVEVADDRDLDGKYGDPVVRFKPRDWTGPDMKGSRYSECPAEFLDLLAGSLDYFARKDEESGKTASNGKPAALYTRKDAARARGWAKRIRGGYVNRSTGELHEPAGPLEAGDPFEQSEWTDDADL
jgi:hypothetical protein